MIDLSACRARARDIDTVIDHPVAGFITVSDYMSAADAMENGDANVPALYVSLANEAPRPNRRSTGPIAQLVDAQVSFLFCLGVERADEERSDALERARGSIIAKFLGWQAPGAQRGFHYAGYQIRGVDRGLVWAEVLMSANWDLAQAG